MRRRILAVIAAATAAVGPAVACANFCQQPIAGEIAATHHINQAPAAPMTAADCDMTEHAAPAAPSQTQDPNCQSGGDCPTLASEQAPALASASVISVDAPAMATIAVIVSPTADISRPHRHRPTPPANGPPRAATPVLLNDILRL